MGFLFKKKKIRPTLQLSFDQLEELKDQPFGTKGSIQIDGKTFVYHDAASFYTTWREIFVNHLYKFHSRSPQPYIVDCGANMGVSVLYFAKNYPGAQILAFEPDPAIYQVLEKNVSSFSLSNVSLSNKAVWDSKTVLTFYTDNGMAGSVENTYKNQVPMKIHTERLLNYLDKRVDLLKMDIEGAEFTVLKDCIPGLKNVDHLFVEYHSFTGKEQHLEEILLILKNAGFRYHLRESFSRLSPFVDNNYACENLELAVNVFGYRI
jgi:FkbM family methyltransferase